MKAILEMKKHEERTVERSSGNVCQNQQTPLLIPVLVFSAHFRGQSFSVNPSPIALSPIKPVGSFKKPTIRMQTINYETFAKTRCFRPSNLLKVNQSDFMSLPRFDGHSDKTVGK